MTAAAAQLRRDHLPFLVLLAVAAALRLAVFLAYRPVLWFSGDSYAYLGVALAPSPYDVRPVGYSFFLEALMPLHRLSAVAAVQHLLGLALGVGVYALLRRLQPRRWVAVAAAAPVLLDAYQLQLEQLLMADTLGLALVGLALGLLVATDKPSVATCAWVGLILGAAALTRSVALVLVVPAVGYLVARRAGFARLLALVALFALPLHLYAGWFQAVHGQRALTATDGFFLYGRVMTFATCEGLELPPPHEVLCDPRPPEERPGLEFYIWSRGSPAMRLPGTRIEQNAVLRDFALTVIRNQPGDYLRAMLADVGQAVSPFREPLPSEFTYRNYRFPIQPRPLPGVVREQASFYQDGRGDGRTEPVLALARPLRAYQDVVAVPGTAYLAAAVLAAAGLVRRGPAGPQDRRRAVCGLFLASGLAVVAVPIVTQGFDYRYLLPALPMLSIAAALGLDLLRTRRARPDRAELSRRPGQVGDQMPARPPNVSVADRT